MAGRSAVGADPASASTAGPWNRTLLQAGCLATGVLVTMLDVVS